MPSDPPDRTTSPSDPPPSPQQPPILVEARAALDELVDVMADCDVVAVDTESNSMHAYRERVCLIQVTAGGRDWIVDPLAVDVAPLGPLMADPKVEMIFHAAEYDVICLRRDFGWSFAGLFDTMLAARILAWPKFGLAAVLEEHFGVRLNKKMQRHDWGKRPLTQAAIDYARLDTHHLHRLREIQLEQLTAAGRVEEARAAFDRVAQAEVQQRPYDLDGYWKIKGARKLEPAQASALRSLWRMRDALAQRLDRPHFKVAGDNALMAIATALPGSANGLRNVPDVPPGFVRRHGPRVLEALAGAREAEPPVPPSRPTPHRVPTPVDIRLDALMAWRKAVAAERGVETDVIATKKVLKAIAEAGPTNLEALERCDAFDRWQLTTYGEAVLAALDAAT